MANLEKAIPKNRFQNRSDVQTCVHQLCAPLLPHYSPGKALVNLGATSTNYGVRRSEMEAFARPWWGLGPLAAGGGDSEFWENCRTGLINGTNTDHPEYWGDLGDVDQLAVEMPPLALAIALAPKTFWDPLSVSERNQVAAWFDQINHHQMSDNNWRAFPILVNVAMKKANMPYNADVMKSCLDRLEDFYIGDGWYSDGTGARMDYYIPFAMHFYTLIYAKLMGDEDPERATIYRQRATKFAKEFKNWFTCDGSALPFGRSLTYRFAQGAFWGALAFADVEGLPWGEIKGLYLRHLRHWFSQPILSSDGLLTIGYEYPNLLMSEFYNGPGSPYWAMKAFLPLALSDDHPFWKSEELPLSESPPLSVQKKALVSIARSDRQDHIVALTSGQWCALDFGHTAEKYSKFAYSSHFGFSVSRAGTGLANGAHDSILALSDGGDYWRVRRQCESVKIDNDVITSIWKPWPDVVIETRLEHCYPWHFRTHTIRTRRVLETAEGGFAAAHDTNPDSELLESGAFYQGSGILNISGSRTARLVEPMPNTNLISPRTIIPTLTGRIEPGEHVLSCAVLGERDIHRALAAWNRTPAFRRIEESVLV